ncbi:MAG: hypothetical protein NTW17_02945, partial [Candidatus Pacearchaeota archaeon]|nr:hypothetical protein [Candidatus Pacearchaeota archaeon]
MERTRLAKASIEELKGKRREAEIRKKYFENYLKKLHESYASGKISFSFYVETLHLHRDGRDIKGWIEYYEHYIRECERLIKKHKKNIAKTRIPIIALSFIALVFVILFLSQSALQFTGFAVQEDQEIAADPGINATINTFQQQAVLGQPVKWIKTISLNIPSDIRLNLPKEAEDIQIIKSYSGENSEEVFPNQTSPFQEKSSSSSETNIGFSMTGAVISETGGKSRILNFFRRITRLTGFAVQQESNQQIGIEINETNTTEYEISYETPAPQSSEKDIEKGKRITIISPKNLHYENVLAFTNLSENLNIRNPSQIKIHWLENNTYVESSSVQDKNNNGIYDYVEWIVPHLSEQTFEIIVITKAEHLDSNMKFISDIYNEVRELDNIWSESINDGEHVRVTFEKNLTNSNDITIYPRVISGNPYIEVYEKDKTKKIATFNSLTSNEYNKVILTNLQNSQDTFDLKVISGSVEFDHIIDPTSELVISGGTVELCGNEARYDKILVTSTGILQICARNATVNTGWLNISLGTAGNFTVESGGIITGQGRGGRGGAAYTGNSGNGTQGENGNNWTAGAAKTLPNGGGGGGGGRTVNTASAGGGGGGFGGKGGLGGMQTGIRSSAGNSYGSTSDVTLLGGSGGGGAATDGGGTGAGGGAGLKIDVGIGVIKINGNISLIGNVGIAGSSTDQGAGGGGSGGHLILSGSSINLNSAKLNVTGGRGGNAPGAGTDDCGGGGGGGGIIYIVYSTMSNTSVTTEAKGAGGGTSYCATAPTAGSLGNVTYNFTTATFPDNLPQWSNPNVNNSNPATEAVVIHNVSWTDDGELSLAILEVNGTGAGCDTTANVSSIDIAGSYNQSNLTWVIPSACAGKAIGWRQWGFDFPNNQSNVTSTQIYVVQADNPPAYFFPSTNETSPLPNRAVSYNVNWTDTGTLSAAILEINSTGAN